MKHTPSRLRSLRQHRLRNNWATVKKQANAHKYKGIDDDGVDDVRHIENHISPLMKVINL